MNHKYFRQPRTSKTRFPRQVKDFCVTEFRQDTPYWQCCETGINYALRHATDLSSLDDVYQILSQGLMHYFQTGKQMQSNAPSGFAVQKWHHYAQLRQPGTPNLHTLFTRWKHFSLFQKMEKMHTRWVKEVKHTMIKQLTIKTQQAFQQRDSFPFYHAISRSCPRQKTKRIHLKNVAGEFLTPTEETATYVQFITDNWTGPPIVLPDLPTPGVPFTLTELEQVIATIHRPRRSHQALHRDHWKSQSMFIAEWLMLESEPTTYPPNMARCMGMLASKPTYTTNQAGEPAYAGVARAILP